jgi:hypothetical protein
MDRMIPAKAVEARERIFKNNDLAGAVRVLFELRQEKRERERAPVTGAQGVLEARPVIGVPASPRSTTFWLMMIC